MLLVPLPHLIVVTFSVLLVLVHARHALVERTARVAPDSFVAGLVPLARRVGEGGGLATLHLHWVVADDAAPGQLARHPTRPAALGREVEADRLKVAAVFARRVRVDPRSPLEALLTTGVCGFWEVVTFVWLAKGLERAIRCCG